MKPSRYFPVLIAGACFGLAGCGGGGGGSGGGGSVTRLTAGGSTFIGPMMKKWSSVYGKEKGVEIDYALKGSGNGIQQMIAKTYHFGCTDAPMNEEQLKAAQDKGGAVLHIPLVMGAVVPVYNIPELKDHAEPLKFTGEVLGLIYLGKIDNWNDPALKKINPGVPLPDRKIAVVHRAEPSGTTFIWTSYLAATSKDWKAKVGAGRMQVTWPAASSVGAQGTAEVASQVSGTAGAIGYVELTYALEKQVAFGAVENRDHKFIHAKTENVTAAAQGAVKDIPDTLTFELINEPGPDAYPICGTTWAVLYKDQPAGKGQAVVDFLRWATHEGQEYTAERFYARLPGALVERIDQKLKSVSMHQ